jgi:uncharacterized RDD family membrane protein YckC
VFTGQRAGFWRRFAAACIDGIILVIIDTLLRSALHHSAAALMSFAADTAYLTLLEGGREGQTVGKAALRIRVTTIEDGAPLGYPRAFIRELGRILSAIPLYLGYLWMLWDPQKQTWHDKLARSVVVRA